MNAFPLTSPTPPLPHQQSPATLTDLVEDPAVVEGAGGVKRTRDGHHEQRGDGQVVQQVLHRLQAALAPVEHEQHGRVAQHRDHPCRRRGGGLLVAFGVDVYIVSVG